MTHEEFHRLAETWGGDIDRWPPGSHDAARRMAETREGSAIIANARALDALLAVRPKVAPERAAGVAFAVVQRIAGSDQATSGMRRWGFDVPNWLLPAASMACSVLIGISMAMLLSPGSEPDTIILSMILDSGSMAAGWTFQ